MHPARSVWLRLMGLCVPVGLLATPAHARVLTFDDRVKAEEAIERVY